MERLLLVGEGVESFDGEAGAAGIPHSGWAQYPPPGLIFSGPPRWNHCFFKQLAEDGRQHCCFFNIENFSESSSRSEPKSTWVQAAKKQLAEQRLSVYNTALTRRQEIGGDVEVFFGEAIG